jgi:hypothetical protein
VHQRAASAAHHIRTRGLDPLCRRLQNVYDAPALYAPGLDVQGNDHLLAGDPEAGEHQPRRRFDHRFSALNQIADATFDPCMVR